MRLLLLTFVAGGLLCLANTLFCEPSRTVDDLFHSKSSTTFVQVEQRGDGMGALLHSIIYLAAYVKFRGWSFGEFNRHLVDRPHPHGAKKGLIFEFLFPNINQMGLASSQDNQTKIVHIEKSPMLDPLNGLPNTAYEIHSDFFELDAIARNNNCTLDRYLNANFLELLRNVSSCSVMKELAKRSVFKGNERRDLRVVAHVRRGDVQSNSDRYMSDEYFIKVLTAIRDIYPRARLHVFSHNDNLTNENTAIWNQYLKQNITVHVANEYLETNTAQTITAMAHFMTADVFMMSKSSFSAVPAFYNPNCVLYTPFWHDPLNNWIILPANHSAEIATNILKSQLPACVKALRHRISSAGHLKAVNSKLSAHEFE